MMMRLMSSALIAMCALMAEPVTTVRAQEVSFKVENPDRRLWRLRNEDDLFRRETNFQCVHSLCPAATSLLITEAKGPAKRPTKAELQTIATRDVPAALAKSGQPLDQPKIAQTTIKGWPALRGTYAIAAGDKQIGIAFAQIHLDGAVVLLRATSGDRSFAPRALDAFLENLTLRAP